MSFWRFVVKTECHWRFIAKYCGNSWALGTHALFSPAAVVVSSGFEGDSRLEIVPTLAHPSSSFQCTWNLNTFSRSYCAARAEPRREDLVSAPAPPPHTHTSASAASAYALFLLVIYLLILSKSDFFIQQEDSKFSGYLLTKGCKCRVHDAPSSRTSALCEQYLSSSNSQLPIFYIIYIFPLLRLFCPFRLFSVSQHN